MCVSTGSSLVTHVHTILVRDVDDGEAELVWGYEGK